MPAIRAWSDALWGAGGPWTRPLPVTAPLPHLPREARAQPRDATQALKRALIERDGHRCRFCGIRIIRAEVRDLVRRAYPDAVRWGDRNRDQHCGFQALWLQYDHVVPWARGGTSEFANMIVTCAPCNNGRSNLTLDEAGLLDPRLREPIHPLWDGLERFVA